MSDILKAVQSIAQFKVKLEKVHIEDSLFRLFSKVTVGCLFLCAGLVTMQTLVGEHIRCISPPKEDAKPEAVSQYCFIMSTYTLPVLYNKSIGEETAHFGVGPHDPEKDERKYHRYYQWVAFALFFQGLSFLIPHYLWKGFEEGRIKAYCDLELGQKITGYKDKDATLKLKGRGLLKHDDIDKKEKSINKAAISFEKNLTYNKMYAFFYMFCEWLNFIMVILNFYLTNQFLGSNSFKNYGPEVVSYMRNYDATADDSINPMSRVFPKVAKCDFHKFGPGGNLIRYDILCILALNIINEKIYVFLWFWFVILSIIGGLGLIYRLLLVFLPGIRSFLIRRDISPTYRPALNEILNNREFSYGDWFLLKLLSHNIDSLRFGELCEGIKEALRGRNVRGRMTTTPSSPISNMQNGKDIDNDTDHESSTTALMVTPKGANAFDT